MKTDDINLPPLPPRDDVLPKLGDRAIGYSPVWNDRSMLDYGAACARAAVEADRQGRMPSDAELDDLSDEFHGYSGNHTRDGYLIPKFDHIGYARALLSRYGSSQSAASAEPVAHTDDDAVNRFAAAMKDKMAQARAKGRHGWQECDPSDLSQMLRAHVEKGDPRDVANFCCFLWSLGKPISAAPVAQEPVGEIRHYIYSGTARNGIRQEAVLNDDAPNMPDGTPFYAAPVAAQALPCNHVFEARPIDGSTSANVSYEPVCRKCGYRPAAQPKVTNEMVTRFLGWKLPADFYPDCGISFKSLGHPNGWPTGTNLFTEPQARAMLEYVIQGKK